MALQPPSENMNLPSFYGIRHRVRLGRLVKPYVHHHFYHFNISSEIALRCLKVALNDGQTLDIYRKVKTGNCVNERVNTSANMAVKPSQDIQVKPTTP
jgi:hypothetical protein